MDNNQRHPSESNSDKQPTLHPLQRFHRLVSKKQQRKLWARRTQQQSIWFGLGLLGLVGWSVALPALLGAALGIWLDKTLPTRFSWTLTLLLAGLILGCWNAWHWVTREQASIERSSRPQPEHRDD